MKNETVLFENIAPHTEPVSISDLLTDIEAVIKKHVILSDPAAAALAVWVLHTYTFELRDTVAYVAIESPEKRCGKTTLLSVLAAMARKPLIASNITVGALFRAIHTCSPALFIDEADTFLAGNSIMRGIINSGNTRRTAYVLRLSASKQNRRPPLRASPAVAEPGEGIRENSEYRGEGRSENQRNNILPLPANPSPAGAGEGGRRPGEGIRGNSVCCGEGRGEGESNRRPGGGIGENSDYRGEGRGLSAVALAKADEGNLEPTASHPSPGDTSTGLKKYSCWCPKVIAMIGEVPDTIADRSIVVKMARKLVSETCAPLAELNTAEIKSKCARFALDAGPEIARARKIHGAGLNDRAADTFDPLYVIARLAGEEWETKLHTAAITLASTDDAEKSGSGLILDILDIFFDCCREKIFTRDLVARLRDGGMKSQALKYSSINEYQISKILRPYGIKPASVRIGAEVKQGYVAADFHEALNRYVSRADKEARVEAIQRRVQLQVEAHAEEQKRKAMFDKVLARAPRSVSEAKAMFEEELKNNPLDDEENDFETAPSSSDNNVRT